ncbi:sacsin like HSP90 chaperone domain, partial [Cryptosporidium canis]
NGYKNPKSRDNSDTFLAHYTLHRTEEEIGNESKLISETLEELGVTTQISSSSLIKILQDYKKMMGLRDKDSVRRSRQVKFKPLYEPDLSHIVELAVFGFGITREKLFVSDWWSSLMDEWSSLSRSSQDQNLQSPSDIDIISDIYSLLGQQVDFDLSVDIKRLFYTQRLLYIPLMKSELYNWMSVDYNTMQPVHHHYAYLWLRECPHLLKDESKEGKIKFESFINISICKFLAAFQMNQSKKYSWWNEFVKKAKIPVKGMHKFLRREDCCVEDFPIGSLK